MFRTPLLISLICYLLNFQLNRKDLLSENWYNMSIINISMAVIINGKQTRHVKLFLVRYKSSSNSSFHVAQYAHATGIIGDCFSLSHYSQKLFLKWIVDMYVRIEDAGLHFIRQNQANLRSEVYNNLSDFLEAILIITSVRRLFCHQLLVSNFKTINNKRLRLIIIIIINYDQFNCILKKY